MTIVPQTYPGRGLDQLTLEELRNEHAFWDQKIQEAQQWGAAVPVSAEFRDGCASWIARREREEVEKKVRK